MAFEHIQGYREFLTAVHKDRQRINPSYSLRAFARDLQLSPSRLSEIINGSNMSLATARKMLSHLNIDVRDQKYFMDLVTLEEGTDSVDVAEAKSSISNYRDYHSFKRLDAKLFDDLADWYHLAIHSYLEMNPGDSADSIAKHLLLSPVTVEAALRRLGEAGFVVNKDSGYEATHPSFHIFSNAGSGAIRKFHKQVLDLAKQALDNQSIEQRFTNTLFFKVSASKLPELRQKINDLMMEFYSFDDQDQEYIYCLNANLFSLSKTIQRKEDFS